MRRNEIESVIGNGFPLAKTNTEDPALSVERINQAAKGATRLLGLPKAQQLKVLARLFNLELVGGK